MQFSLAHLSDLHLPPPAEAMSMRDRNLKSVLAKLSWHRKRKRIYTLHPAAALLADIAAQAPDHIALTGDITNFGHPAEFVAARRYLQQIGAPHDLSVVPGNHDRTVPLPWQDSLEQWQDWMCSDAEEAVLSEGGFPFLRRRGDLAIIGVDSAILTPVFKAYGEIGMTQMHRLAELLEATGRQGLFRAVLIHHPPTMSLGGERKALRDRAALCAVLAQHGAELMISGHHHITRLDGVQGPSYRIPSFGVPAALASKARPEWAGWHLHRIERVESGWHLTSALRRYNPIRNVFEPGGEWSFRLPVRTDAMTW
ncbi:metallophosphoesterase [Acidisoma cellulosilytica]|uniref:Metallophosphoesterase n=1 Tax=Acidisoma cellulosilyticum TaxID=2802395 RepID=A0A963Z443_9PROT|nr:metallophosphoesterase [Acidisoma cellulosilyticum]MCB8882454.1 metallophosphoesterase [Acidisoma cellulosilyticum]